MMNAKTRSAVRCCVLDMTVGKLAQWRELEGILRGQQEPYEKDGGAESHGACDIGV